MTTVGHTLPPLASSTLRMLLFALPAYAISRQPGFEMRQVWYVALAAVVVQMGLNLWLLHREFDRRLDFGRSAAAPAQAWAATGG